MCQLCTAHDACSQHGQLYTCKHAWINTTPFGQEYKKQALRFLHVHVSTYLTRPSYSFAPWLKRRHFVHP